MGKNQSTIANKLRLLKLSHEVKQKLSEAGLTERHARALLKLPDDSYQLKALKIVIDKDLNVSETDKLVQGMINKILDGDSSFDAENRPQSLMKISKNMKIFLNTIGEALKLINRAGVFTESNEVEHDDYYEYIIKIKK